MNGQWWFRTRLGQEKVSSSELQECLWRPPSLLFIACWCYSRRVKAAGGWSCRSLPSYADEKTAWIYTSILPSPFVVLCLPLPQITNGLAWDRIRTYVVRGWRLLLWSTCRMSDLIVKYRRQLLDIFWFRQNNCKKFFIVICLITDISVLLFYTCQGFGSRLPRLCTGTLTKVHVAVSKSRVRASHKTLVLATLIQGHINEHVLWEGSISDSCRLRNAPPR